MGNIQLNYSKNIGKSHIDALALMEGQNIIHFILVNKVKATKQIILNTTI